MYSYIAIICIGDRVRAKNKFLKLVGYILLDIVALLQIVSDSLSESVYNINLSYYSYTGICLAIVIIVQELVSVVALIRS